MPSYHNNINNTEFHMNDYQPNLNGNNAEQNGLSQQLNALQDHHQFTNNGNSHGSVRRIQRPQQQQQQRTSLLQQQYAEEAYSQMAYQSDYTQPQPTNTISSYPSTPQQFTTSQQQQHTPSLRTMSTTPTINFSSRQRTPASQSSSQSQPPSQSQSQSSQRRTQKPPPPPPPPPPPQKQQQQQQRLGQVVNEPPSRKKQRRDTTPPFNIHVNSNGGGSGNLTNEESLRKQATEALSFSLEEFAAQMRTPQQPPASTSSSLTTSSNDKDMSAETQRQVFGLTWLLRSCSLNAESVVPRNTIYTTYSEACGEFDLKPLSAASFGKLVRVIFPDVATRRLGTRGMSKYHYCGLKLVNGNSGEESGVATPGSVASGDFEIHNGNGASLNGNRRQTNERLTSPAPPSTASLPSVETQQPKLRFIPGLIKSLNEQTIPSTNTQLEIPTLKPYLRNVNSYSDEVHHVLQTAYKTYCSSIFDALRFLQLNKLYLILNAFLRTLPEQAARLYFSEECLAWINDCDTVMYDSIIRMLAKLALQKIPAHVLQQLKQISVSFPRKVMDSLVNSNNYTPSNKLIALKTKHAQRFTRIITRLIRVSETAQSAGTILQQQQDRDLMYQDWTRYVNVEHIVIKELPCQGSNFIKVVNLIQTIIPELLLLQSPSQTIIDTWGSFIAEIPSQFPSVSPRIFILCVSALLTSALREISLAGGAGFGAWWVTRCWIDEWVGWCAELGGVLGEDDTQGSSLDDGSEQVQLDINGVDDEQQVNGVNGVGIDEVDLLDAQFGPS